MMERYRRKLDEPFSSESEEEVNFQEVPSWLTHDASDEEKHGQKQIKEGKEHGKHGNKNNQADGESS